MTAQNAACYDPQTRQLTCEGDWDVAHIPMLKTLFRDISWPKSGEITIDGHGIVKMDSAGAWLLTKWQSDLAQLGIKINLQKFSQQHQTLLSIITKRIDEEKDFPEVQPVSWVTTVGKNASQQWNEVFAYLNFVG